MCVCVCVCVSLCVCVVRLIYGIALNYPLLHSNRCLDTFDFLFSGILMLLLWSEIMLLRTCVDSIYTSLLYICYIRLCRQLFWSL